MLQVARTFGSEISIVGVAPTTESWQRSYKTFIGVGIEMPATTVLQLQEEAEVPSGPAEPRLERLRKNS